MMAKKQDLVSQQQIESAVLLLRGEKVLLDADLATLYGVATKALVQAVKRNRHRFPGDFMFRLSPHELAEWRSQIVTSMPPVVMNEFQKVGPLRTMNIDDDRLSKHAR
jgi:hypothetical protein